MSDTNLCSIIRSLDDLNGMADRGESHLISFYLAHFLLSCPNCNTEAKGFISFGSLPESLGAPGDGVSSCVSSDSLIFFI